MRSNLALASLVIGNLALGLGVQLLIFRTLGFGAMTDSLIAAQTLPMLAVSVVGAGLLNVWQPQIAIATGRDRRRIAGLAIGQASTALVAASIGIWVAAPIVMDVVFFGFHGEQLQIATALTRILALTAFFNGLVMVLAGLSRAEGRFLIGETIPLIALIATVATVIPAAKIGGVEGVAWVLVIQSGAAFLGLWGMLGAPFVFELGDIRQTGALRLAGPLMASSAIHKLTPFLDRLLLSQASAGSISLYTVGQMGGSSLATIIDRSVTVPLMPSFARWWAEGHHGELRSGFRRAMARGWIFVAAIALGMLMVSPFWESITMHVLGLRASPARELFWVCVALLGLIAGSTGGTVAASALYSTGDTKIVSAVGLLGFIVSIGLKVFAFQVFGIIGLAFATSIYYMYNYLIMWYFLEKRIARFVTPAG
jgi:putative peptidoglycan lipid II flippase